MLSADNHQFMTAKKPLKTTSKEEVVKVEQPQEEVKIDITNEEEKKEIKVIERIIENREIAPADVFGKLERSQIDLIKRTVAKGASDDELKLFIQVCKGANLNPFMKQVFLVPRWDSREGKEIRAIQVSIDGLRAIAEEGGAYAGNEDPTFEGEESVTLESKKVVKHPLSAKVTVYKIVEGNRYPFTATARWEEYYPGAKMGFQWHVRPYLMLGKCAEALALRKAFPKLLSGMYAQEELDRSTGESQPEQNKASGIETIKKVIATSNMDALDEFTKKMAKSTKYTDEQKAEFKKLVDKRMSEITGEPVIQG